MRRQPAKRRPIRSAGRGLVRLAAVLCLSAALSVHAASFPRDPFGTAGQVPVGRAQAWKGAGAGPCTTLAPRARPWTLVDVVDRALCENPQTRETWAAARAQAARLGASESAYLPTINLTMNASRSRISSSGGFQIPAQNRLSPSLSLDYLLFDFGGRSAAVANARETLYAADWTHNATLQSVLLGAVQGYYRVFAARAGARAARASEQSSREALDAARLRYRVGAATLA
ncbi:MAG TPA: TolC family protein, partial [Chromatiales bacterium]|nr:TolC family protein [Chromatiales bacterium]